MGPVNSADVVVDACDNFATRHEINRACVALRNHRRVCATHRNDRQPAGRRRNPSAGRYAQPLSWLVLFDAEGMEWQRVKLSRSPDCAVCSIR